MKDLNNLKVSSPSSGLMSPTGDKFATVFDQTISVNDINTDIMR